MGVASGCGCKEAYTVDFRILLIPTPLVSVHFCSSTYIHALINATCAGTRLYR